MTEYFWEYFSQKMQDPGFSDGQEEVRWTSYISRGRLPPGAGRYHPTRAILQYGTLKRTAWHAAAARLAWPRRRRRLLRLGACEGEGPADYPPLPLMRSYCMALAVRRIVLASRQWG